MYGTVARMRLRPGMESRLQQSLEEVRAENVPGFIAAYTYRMDNDPNECFMAVIFDSKENYVRNAESSAQNERYERLLTILEGAPEWHDGEIVASAGRAGDSRAVGGS